MSIGKGIQLSTSFDVNTAQPLDSRQLVDSLEERDALVNVYNGLRCYVNGVGEFKYINGEWHNEGADESKDEVYIGTNEPSEGNYSVWIDPTGEPITSDGITDLVINEFRVAISTLQAEIASLRQRVSDHEIRIAYLEMYGGGNDTPPEVQGTQLTLEDGSVLTLEDGSILLLE